MMNNIYIEEEVILEENLRAALEKAVNAVCAEEKLPPVSICILICDKERIREINREERNIDSPTDVLSFPDIEPSEETGLADIINAEVDPETGKIWLGDMAICMDVIREHAAEYGNTVEKELMYMAVHSVYHLLGYDHMEEEDKKVMREREEAVMSIL